MGKSIKLFSNTNKEQAQVRVSRKLFLVSDQGPRRLKHNIKNNCILNCGNVCKLQCQNGADHKHQINHHLQVVSLAILVL